MSIASLSDPQLKRALNIASWTDVAGIAVNTSGISTGIAGNVIPPNSSGLTTTFTGGATVLTNTVDGSSYNNTATITRYPLEEGKNNTYINVISKTAGAAGTFTFNINPTATGHLYPPGSGNLPVGSFISIHIDAGNTQTVSDTYTIQYGVASSVTCTIGNTYTFMCFTSGFWTRM